MPGLQMVDIPPTVQFDCIGFNWLWQGNLHSLAWCTPPDVSKTDGSLFEQGVVLI
jgi:hypothetical protein